MTKRGKIFIYLSVFLCIGFTAIGFFLDIGIGIFSLCFSSAFIGITLFRELSVHSQIKKLSREVEKAVHNAERLSLDSYEESDLSILVNQISKMLRKILESEDMLKKDKKLLADSIADISHQIRTPLTSVGLITSFLQNPDIDNETRAEHVTTLRNQLKRIDWLVNALLKLSKLDAGTAEMLLKRTELTELVDHALSPLLIPIELKNIELFTKCEGCAKIDLQWTAEALENIIKNCMEHTQSGGRIEIIASENPLYSEIKISDSGCGIGKEDLPHIFERFYKGKNSSESSIGIGLSMSRIIINEQSGTVKASNKPGGGAEFVIKFYKSII